MCFRPGERIGGLFFGVAQQVMPLEYLVENDTVDESAEAWPIKKA